jgi:hypothetical protein
MSRPLQKHRKQIYVGFSIFAEVKLQLCPLEDLTTSIDPQNGLPFLPKCPFLITFIVEI